MSGNEEFERRRSGVVKEGKRRKNGKMRKF